MKSLSTLFLVIALALLTTACSLIGLTIGAISDSQKPPFTQVSYPDTQAVIQQARTISLALKPGSEIVVTTRDSAQIAGKYRGIGGTQDEPAIKISTKETSRTYPSAPFRKFK